MFCDKFRRDVLGDFRRAPERDFGSVFKRDPSYFIVIRRNYYPVYEIALFTQEYRIGEQRFAR